MNDPTLADLAHLVLALHAELEAVIAREPQVDNATLLSDEPAARVKAARWLAWDENDWSPAYAVFDSALDALFDHPDYTPPTDGSAIRPKHPRGFIPICQKIIVAEGRG